LSGDRATHHHHPAETIGQAGIQAQRERQIGQWAEHDQQQPARVATTQADDRQRGVFGLGGSSGGQIADIAKAVQAVNMAGVRRRAQQLHRAAGIHRNVDAGDFAQLHGIGHGVRQADVSGRNGQADHLMVWRGKSHQQGQRVVHAGVGVDQQRDTRGMRRHRRSMPTPGRQGKFFEPGSGAGVALGAADPARHDGFGAFRRIGQ
jgi:hypothetical protein